MAALGHLALMRRHCLANLLFASSLTASLHAHEAETQQPFERKHAHDALSGHFHAGYESHYFSEGRDNLDGDSLWTTSLEVAWNHFSGGVWLGSSPDQDYDELQLTLALSESFGDFEVYLAYTHLQFLHDHTDDNEVGAGISWSGLPWELGVSLEGYYSFDAEGSFWELALDREFEVNEKITVSGGATFGVNQGYIADGHDGANHLALHVGLGYQLTESLSLNAHAAYSWAIDRDNGGHADDESLVDLFHGGVGLQWTF